MIKPLCLERGDTIGVIAPASPVFESERIELGIDLLKAVGFNVRLGESCYKKYGYLSGSDSLRAQDINSFFEDKTIDGIICLRGGYGTMRLLELIDYDSVRDNPKVFVGYSDITALHSAFHKKCKMITFHGPMVASDLYNNNPTEVAGLISAVSGNIIERSYELTPIKGGNIHGRIVGGNLCMLCSIIGSKYQEELDDKILFLEEIDEEPYRIDRMLHQLKLSGVLNGIKGILLGQFIDCEAKNPLRSLSLKEVFLDFFSKLEIPVFSDLSCGHGDNKITIPLGINIKVVDNVLYFMEEGVI